MVFLFTALFVSLIGLGLFLYGRKQHRPPQLGAGVVLMVYPQVADSSAVMLGVTIGVLALTWLGVRMGM